MLVKKKIGIYQPLAHAQPRCSTNSSGTKCSCKPTYAKTQPAPAQCSVPLGADLKHSRDCTCLVYKFQRCLVPTLMSSLCCQLHIVGTNPNFLHCLKMCDLVIHLLSANIMAICADLAAACAHEVGVAEPAGVPACTD